MTSFADGSEWQLVFSDEFNTPNRTFWPGDDAYWEAANLHYWQVRFPLPLPRFFLTCSQTNDLEWYEPNQVITKDGALQITLDKRSAHNLDYVSGMISTWNKFCFTGGMVLASVSLPGANNVVGTHRQMSIHDRASLIPSSLVRIMACRSVFAHPSLTC